MLSDYDAGELRRIAFAERAELFTAEAEPSDILGLSAPTSDFAVAVARSDAEWTFTFRDGDAVAGTLSFAALTKLAKFEVDTRVQTPPEGGMVTLYKEWKLTAPARATGMFKLTPNSSASLILQGRGNGCSSADDFRHWTLVVQGDGFAFHFFGDLAQPTASK